MLRKRMGIDAKNVAEYFIDKFSSNTLEKDDLRQEAYLIFLKAQETYNPEKRVGFKTWYSQAVKNHFIDLYRRDKKRIGRHVSISVDEAVFDLIDCKLGPEDLYVYETLIVEIKSRLNGLAFKLFELKLNPYPIRERFPDAPKNELAFMYFRKYLDCTVSEMQSALVDIQKSLYIALGKRSREIGKLVEFNMTTFH